MTKDEERWVKIGKAAENAVLRAIHNERDGDIIWDVTEAVVAFREEQDLSCEAEDYEDPDD